VRIISIAIVFARGYTKRVPLIENNSQLTVFQYNKIVFDDLWCRKYTLKTYHFDRGIIKMETAL
jgi:hypothetical protein